HLVDRMREYLEPLSRRSSAQARPETLHKRSVGRSGRLPAERAGPITTAAVDLCTIVTNPKTEVRAPTLSDQNFTAYRLDENSTDPAPRPSMRAAEVNNWAIHGRKVDGPALPACA